MSLRQINEAEEEEDASQGVTSEKDGREMEKGPRTPERGPMKPSSNEC